ITAARWPPPPANHQDKSINGLTSPFNTKPNITTHQPHPSIPSTTATRHNVPPTHHHPPHRPATQCPGPPPPPAQHPSLPHHLPPPGRVFRRGVVRPQRRRQVEAECRRQGHLIRRDGHGELEPESDVHRRHHGRPGGRLLLRPRQARQGRRHGPEARRGRRQAADGQREAEEGRAREVGEVSAGDCLLRRASRNGLVVHYRGAVVVVASDAFGGGDYWNGAGKSLSACV
ncbi:hypothetical protein GE09DRAFT_1180892, partial [Coniochaeta sp. 2T2.1]